MNFISYSDSRHGKKAYIIIFILSISFLLAGFVIITVANVLPSIDSGDPGRDLYLYLMTILSSASILAQNLGIVLFSVSTFLGALTDESLSKEVQKALVITSGIGIIALVLFNRLILYFY